VGATYGFLKKAPLPKGSCRANARLRDCVYSNFNNYNPSTTKVVPLPLHKGGFTGRPGGRPLQYSSNKNNRVILVSLGYIFFLKTTPLKWGAFF